jgi:hypothetical protein
MMNVVSAMVMEVAALVQLLSVSAVSMEVREQQKYTWRMMLQLQVSSL